MLHRSSCAGAAEPGADPNIDVIAFTAAAPLPCGAIGREG
jgi:hypothetical protein